MSADLIKRLEDVAEGTQELSAEIARDVVGHKIHDWPLWIETKSRVHDFSALAPCPAYTTSLDDAVALVPNDLEWSVATLRDPSWKPAEANVYLKPYFQGRDDDPEARQFGHAATPALALCIAALKARKKTRP